MGFKLGNISPIAGIISGKGVFGELANKGALGIAPALIAKNNDKEKTVSDEETAALLNQEKNKRMASMANAQRAQSSENLTDDSIGYKSYKKGGSVSSASKRADGCCVRGKTKGRMV
jgi:hypothetical protein